MNRLAKRVVGWTAASLAAVGAVHLLSAATLDRGLEHKSITYTSPRLPAELDGYTAVFLTDIHGYPQNRLEEMVRRINSRGVDLVLLGGDFSGQKDLERCMEILAKIQAPDGFYGVEGNHDDASKLSAAMETQNMTMLENTGASVRPGLYVGGVEDLWNRSPDPRAATAGAAPDDVVLLLAHNPDVSMECGLDGVDLVLSGHTHGGEITLLGLWAPAMPLVSGYGQRFVSGWCEGSLGKPVFVSRGISPHFYLRVFARPQVIYLTLRREPGGTAAWN